MTERNSLLWIISIFAIITVGYLLYEHIKQEPPAELIELVTKTDPPPPLPVGEAAPLTVPAGFTAIIFARDITGARVMIRDQKGTMLVSQTSEGKVVALPDQDQNAQSDRTVTVLEGLKQPHGLYMHCPKSSSARADQDDCLLLVAETGELKSYRYNADQMKAEYQETLTTYPTGDGHFTRTLNMHPDGKRLLMSVGSSCNVCEEDDERRATVLSYNFDTKEVKTFASGLRNTVFMENDRDGKVWGTDNGRDLIGDDIPPDEVNIIEEGNNYGWPFCYGKNIHDTDFDKFSSNKNICNDKIIPHIELQAHSAPLGLTFIAEEGWPEDMRGDLLVAYHGSWNRSEPTGYKVVRFDLDSSRKATSGPIDFVTGFLTTQDEDDAIGRPVDIMTEDGGVAYLSDDRAGAIYRISSNND